MRKFIAAGIVALGAFGMSSTPAEAAKPAPKPSTSSTYTVTQGCMLEDGSSQVMCIWDAGRYGNKRGTSVVNVDYGDVFAYIRTPRYAVSKRHPLKVTVFTKHNQPYSVRVVQGKEVLARNALLREEW